MNRSVEFEKRTKTLNEILNSHRSRFIKSGIGYDDEFQKGNSSKESLNPSKTVIEEIYATYVKDSINNVNGSRKEGKLK